MLCCLQEKSNNKSLRLALEQTKGCFANIFNEDQVDALRRGTMKGNRWSDATVKKALELKFSCGSTGYGVLLQQGQPLPSIRTLQRRMEAIPFNSGLLHEVFNFMKLKVGTKMDY